MIGKFCLLGGATLLLLFTTSVPARSADNSEPGCVLSGQRTAPIDNTSVFEEKLPNTLFDFPS